MSNPDARTSSVPARPVPAKQAQFIPDHPSPIVSAEHRGCLSPGATLRRIRLNYLWAFGYNTVMIPIAAGALYAPVRLQLPPWVAGAQIPLMIHLKANILSAGMTTQVAALSDRGHGKDCGFTEQVSATFRLRRRGHGTQLPERRVLVAAAALVQAAGARPQERRHGYFMREAALRHQRGRVARCEPVSQAACPSAAARG